MYLNVHNQLTLLHDLLDEQRTLKIDSTNEYKHIKKLVQTIIKNDNMNEELLTVLPEIYYYGMKGERALSVTEHIEQNICNIEKWLVLINRTKQQIS
ncbi:MAG TPA: YtzH-like family protein [Pseudogracilibacillus sp.]|nr:YtzH-like family protein [Pseudogracilibacillus sp.]